MYIYICKMISNFLIQCIFIHVHVITSTLYIKPSNFRTSLIDNEQVQIYI